jgi:hypothetical protein
MKTAGSVQTMGLISLVGCLLFAVVILVYAAVGYIGPEGELTPGTGETIRLGLLHGTTYLLMLGAMLAGMAAGLFTGDRGLRVLYALMVLSLVALTLAMAALLIPALPGEAIAVAGGVSFALVHVLALPLGILLWRRRRVSRLTAGLFMAVVPVIVLVALFGAAGVPVRPAEEATLALAFASLGYDLYAPRRAGPG